MGKSFDPGYTWPNENFPFRIYWESPEVRIFFIDNFSHNWHWISKYCERFRDNDYFFVKCGWSYAGWLAKKAFEMVDFLGLSKERFFVLCNSSDELRLFKTAGFPCDLVSSNAWLDENLAMKILPEEKLYDAIYVGRRSSFKRHMLAEEITNLAIVAGRNHGNDLAPIPSVSYLNKGQLSPEEVCQKINQSRCGLILSAVEGACFASSEYLLCGVPVVSTYSEGGRDIWYDDYNSIQCDPCPHAIANAVSFFVTNPRDPKQIRANHIEESRRHRSRFLKAFEQILERNGVRGVDVPRYFYDTFMHKMRKSIKPDFEVIFPPLS